MRPYLFSLVLIFLAACGTKQVPGKKNQLPASLVNIPVSATGVDTSAANSKPVMSFKDTLHDFGTIHEGETMEYSFEFTNTGKTPLIISNAAASCGCTIADYDRNPILPGGKGSIKVHYNSQGRSGLQEKMISVTTNTNRSTELLYIKTEVTSKK